jgi:hypothetical protein
MQWLVYGKFLWGWEGENKNQEVLTNKLQLCNSLYMVIVYDDKNVQLNATIVQLKCQSGQLITMC